MRNYRIFPTLLICLIGTFLLVACGGQSTDSESVSTSAASDNAFKQALQEQVSDMKDDKDKAAQQWKELEEEEERKAQQIEEEQRQSAEILNYLQGSWVWINEYENTWSLLSIDDYTISDYSEGELSGVYSIRDIDKEDGKIYYGSDLYLEYVVTNDGTFRLFGDKRRGVRFRKLSSRQEKAYAQYCKHIKDWEKTYNDYLNVNVYGAYSRKQAVEDLKGIIGLLNNDLDKMGNNDVCKKQVKRMWNITSGLTPF